MAAWIRFGLFGLLLFSPLPFGSVVPWAVLVFELWAACLGAGALWLIYRDPDALPRGARRLLIPASLLVLIGLLQLVPLPSGIVRVLAAPTFEVREAVAEVLPDATSRLYPLSLSPPDTVDALLRLLACVLVGLAAAVAFRETRHLRLAAVVLVVSGTFQALYGSIEYLSGHQQIFGYVKKSYLESATGTFINRNHFAGYLALILPFALSQVLHRPARPRLHSGRDRLNWLFAPATLTVGLFGLAIGIMLVGVFLSYSRGGLVAVLVAVTVTLLAVVRRRGAAWILILALLVPAVFLSLQELRAPGARFIAPVTEITTMNSRVPVWAASLRAVPHYPLGAGYGTFEPLFRLHQPPAVEGRWTHAHNDWLEALLEGGPVVVGLLGWLIVGLLLLRKGPYPLRNDAVVLASSATAALAAVAAHSLLDFTLRIPAAALLAAFSYGFAVAGSRVPNDADHITSWERHPLAG